MNKKFFSGIVFGLAIGVGLSFAQPMLSQDLNINKSSIKAKKAVTSTNIEIKKDYKIDSSKDETVALLKEIRDILKSNSQQNKEIAEGIKALSDRFRP